MKFKGKGILIILLAITACMVACNGNSNATSSSSSDSDILQEQGTTYWWNETVFYEVFVRSFYDSNGDGKGDLKGLIEKLDYLNDGNPETDTDLGITGIWLMPVSESPSYHGYDVTDYKKIEEDYGSNDDFKLLMSEAHKRGIKVIVDFVMNHTSAEHPWFVSSASSPSSEYRNWYRWSPTNPGYSGPWNQAVWHYKNGMFYYGLFWGGMPDLNYEEEAVRSEMKDIASFWLKDMNVDGFRCDAVKYIYEDGSDLENTSETFDWWREFHTYYKGEKPGSVVVGEAWDRTDIVQNYVGDKFDFCFEFDMASAIKNSIMRSNPSEIEEKMVELTTAYPYHQYGTFLTNHDQNRIIEQLGNSVEKNKLAASIYLSLPGIPFLYYGEEIGMKGMKPDENIRRPMQWSAAANGGFTTGTPWNSLNSNYTSYNVADQNDNEESLLYHYRKLISLRNENKALTKGTYQLLENEDDEILSFLREYQSEGVLIIANFSNDICEKITVKASQTNLEAGQYEVIDLWSNQNVAKLTIDNKGGFDDFEACAQLKGKETKFLKLVKI